MGDRPRCFSSYVLAISPWLPFTLFINPSLTNSHYQSSKSKLTKPTPSSRSLHPLTVAISPSIFHTHFVLTYQVPSPSSLSPCHVHEPCMHVYSSNPMHGHFYSSPSYLHCFMPISTLITRLLYPHVHHLSLSLSLSLYTTCLSNPPITPIIPIPVSRQPLCAYPHMYPSFTPPLTMPPRIIHHTSPLLSLYPCLIPPCPHPFFIPRISSHYTTHTPKTTWTDHHLCPHLYPASSLFTYPLNPSLTTFAWPCMAASCSFHAHAHFVPVSPHPYPYPCKRSSMQMSRAT